MHFLIPVAEAHEVYVLDHAELARGLAAPAFPAGAAIRAYLTPFLGWAFLIVGTLALMLALSLTRPGRRLSRLTDHLKPLAPRIAQLTLGAALTASGYYGAVFGPELSLTSIFGPWAPVASGVLLALGLMIIVGYRPRLAGAAAVALFIAFTCDYGTYLLNYGTYLGEALVLTLWGGAYAWTDLRDWGHPLKFAVLRVLFGLSLIYASLYAKLIHGTLALEVVSKYQLTHYFPFNPIFLVLGAMCIELLFGLCFISGFQLRFISLAFLTFLGLSLIFFGEAVWPHLILIGTALAIFCHGPDAYTLDARIRRRPRVV